MHLSGPSVGLDVIATHCPVVNQGNVSRSIAIQSILVFSFWVALANLCYSYFGYPILVQVASRRCSKRQRVADPNEMDLPSVTVLIAAHNAEGQIRRRIDNLRACDYPPEKLQIVVASDGSTDRTVDIVQEYGDARVQVIAFPDRRGKAATLVEAVGQLDSEVVMFTDASTRFEQDAVRKLMSHFTDGKIGLATGSVAIVNEHGTPVESLYWRSEMTVRRCEADLGIMLGASGAIYAIRRSLFVEPRRPVINDDLVLPTLVQLRHGCEFVFDESAKAYAVSSGGLASEFQRRCRIGAGAFQCIPVLRELLQWRHRKQAFAFGSHKLLRWICPFLLVMLVVTNIALLDNPMYQTFLGLQLTAYLLALFGLFATGRGYVARIARTASSFLVMNLALLTGFFRWMRDSENVMWNPTPRPNLDIAPPIRHE